jgi:glucans biosynthesis protein
MNQRGRRCRYGAKTITGHHPRNTSPMLSSQRCGAKTRSGKPCLAPAVTGKKRFRMHGGAPKSGAPRGNKNTLKHGLYTREAIEERSDYAS